MSFLCSDAQVTSWINKYGWKEQANGDVFVSNQEENIKTKNITEKITFDSESALNIQIMSVLSLCEMRLNCFEIYYVSCNFMQAVCLFFR